MICVDFLLWPFLFVSSGQKMMKVDHSEQEQQILELSEKVCIDMLLV